MIRIKKITDEGELREAFAIRMAVFVAEQGVKPDAELDEYEDICTHVLSYCDGKTVGTGRLRLLGDGTAKLERICILAAHRSRGLGRIIVKELEQIALDMNYSKFKLHGQTHAEGFYISLGYRAEPEIFFEEGIAHKMFIKTVADA